MYIKIVEMEENVLCLPVIILSSSEKYYISFF